MQGQIRIDNWQTYLNDFSIRNAGRTARVEVLSEDLGVQGDVERLPLQGITLDKRSSPTSILRSCLEAEVLPTCVT